MHISAGSVCKAPTFVACRWLMEIFREDLLAFDLVRVHYAGDVNLRVLYARTLFCTQKLGLIG